MSSVEMQGLEKRYGAVFAVKEVTETVREKDFVTLLGPSGCGKTTTLRMIAGLETPTAGRILIGGRVVTDVAAGVNLPPERRNLGMVFQSYAVWPHMTVLQNVAYPLRLRKLAAADMRARAAKALELVRLTGLEERFPNQLSGGQQQRVALARALAMEPEVLLLDEPLSNLDAQLREQMRVEIKEIQRSIGVTVVYVTHDQIEALSMSDRIVVMAAGEVQQVGTPEEIYRQPANPFVASFIGTASMLSGEAAPSGNGVTFLLNDLRIPASAPKPFSGKARLAVRPEDVRLNPLSPVVGRVERSAFLGEKVELEVSLAGSSLRVNTLADAAPRVGDQVGLELARAVAFPA
ncbi:MAG TPA: ABC transporter ATP-binding protein [Deinococcales bacterium]|nr:ABC transporter ATP-binding protein [Deinococcales bacterium]